MHLTGKRVALRDDTSKQFFTDMLCNAVIPDGANLLHKGFYFGQRIVNPTDCTYNRHDFSDLDTLEVVTQQDEHCLLRNRLET